MQRLNWKLLALCCVLAGCTGIDRENSKNAKEESKDSNAVLKQKPKDLKIESESTSDSATIKNNKGDTGSIEFLRRRILLRGKLLSYKKALDQLDKKKPESVNKGAE